MQATINLQGSPLLLGALTDFTYKWLLNAGLSLKESARFTLAVNEMATDIVRFAFPHKDGQFEITYNLEPSYIEVVFKEFGMPFDPDRHVFIKDRALKDGDFDGAGLELIRKMSDKFVYLNHGKKGKEFRIVKTLPATHVSEMATIAFEEPPLNKKYNYRLVDCTSEDAESISRLIYKVYDLSYQKESLYFPKQVERAIANKDKYAVAIKTQDEDLVGYFAILRSTDSLVGEIGEASVSPRHRKKGLMTKMLRGLIRIARKKDLLGLYGEAITVHIISQRANDRFNMKSSALILSLYPPSKYIDIEEKYKQRMAVVVDFVYLERPVSHGVYLPKEYRSILQEIYYSHDIKVVNRPAIKQDLEGRTLLDVKINYDFHYSIIVVKEYGEDFEDSIQLSISDLLKNNNKVIYLDLPLDDPNTKFIIPSVKKYGFVLAGLMPLFHQEMDYLRMQYVAERPDMSTIQLYSDQAKKLKRIISRELKQWTLRQRKEELSSD